MKWNVERNWREIGWYPLDTVSVIVSKTIEGKFEEKLKQTLPKNFRSIRNHIKQESKEEVTTLENKQRKKWLNIKNNNRMHLKEHR